MIFCKACGTPFIVRSIPRGEYRLCCANHNRGSCANANRPSEPLIVEAGKGALLERLLPPEFMREAIARYLADMTTAATQGEGSFT